MLTIIEKSVDLHGGGVGVRHCFGLGQQSGKFLTPVRENWFIHMVASWCNESITLPLASFSAYTRAYSSATLCSWAVARFSSSWYLLTIANMLVSVSHNRWDRFHLALEKTFNSSFKIRLSTRDWSLSSLRSLSSLLLPHRAPRNLFRPCSSLRALLVSCSKALVVAIFISLSLAFSFRILRAADLNLSLTVWACSSSALGSAPLCLPPVPQLPLF